MGPIYILIGGICVGLAAIGVRESLEWFGPFAIAFWRFALAVPFLFLLVLVAERRLPRRPNRFIVMAGVFFAFDMGLWNWGLDFTSVANATFIVNLGSVCAGLTAWIFLRQKPAKIWALAAMIAIAGAATLSFGGAEDGVADWRGDLLALAGGVMLSGYIVASSVARRSAPAVDSIFWMTFAAMITGAITTGLSGEAFLPASIEGFSGPLFLALVAQIAGQGLIILGLGRTSPAIGGVLILIQPVVSAIAAQFWYGETLTLLQISGAGLILVGVFLAQRQKADKNSSHTVDRTILLED